MRGAVEQLLDRYPAATLQDVYKSMFQDRFGVAHLLSGRDAVREYIAKEVDSTEGECEEYYEACGWRGDYIRVDIRAVRDGVMSIDELTDRFMRSAECGPKIDSVTLEAWQHEWTTISTVCRDLLVEIDGYQQDSTNIAELIASGRYVLHHSRRYNEAYKPHYRIVHKSLTP
mgnify:CR=1 FL=1